MRVDAENAYKVALSNSRRKWSRERFVDDFVTVAPTPSFTIAKGDKVFCIGSCFARNIEEQLVYRGVEVLSKRIAIPKTEWYARPNGITNKFTTASMLNELRWLKDPPVIDAGLFAETENGWIDLNLVPGASPVNLDRCIERRSYLLSDYFARLKDADVIIITLGLTETWLDNDQGVFLNTAPSLWQVKKYPGRFQFEITDYNGVSRQLAEIHELVRWLQPAAKLVITTSPVPMGTTFSAGDVLQANSHSKSTLAAAAQDLAIAHDSIDYFPSYEMVTLSNRSTAYGPDCVHVTDSTIGKVVSRFLEAYTGSAEHPYPEFVEMLYLEANEQVDESVRRGEWSSGFEHWIAQGKSMNLPRLPAEIPAVWRNTGLIK
jgi:hypothetical protein